MPPSELDRALNRQSTVFDFFTTKYFVLKFKTIQFGNKCSNVWKWYFFVIFPTLWYVFGMFNFKMAHILSYLYIQFEEGVEREEVLQSTFQRNSRRVKRKSIITSMVKKKRTVANCKHKMLEEDCISFCICHDGLLL